MSQAEYGARRETKKSNEKSSPWPWIIGGAALTGILGADYLENGKIDGFKLLRDMNEFDKKAVSFMDDGILSFSDFKEATHVLPTLDYKSGTPFGGNLEVGLDTNQNKSEELMVLNSKDSWEFRLDANEDGKSDIFLEANKDSTGKLELKEFYVNPDLTPDEQNKIELDSYIKYLEEHTGLELSEN